jgi:hypothetical protein
MYLKKVLEDYSSPVSSSVKVFFNKIVFLVVSFSILYAVFEYYLITDPSYGAAPVLSSLIYPYHFLMAGIFGIAAYLFVFLGFAFPRKNRVLTLILVVAIFGVMLVIEDFAWFTFRAIAPRSEDINAGKLVMDGEWTTQFMGSTGFYFTVIPNWYFLSTSYAGITALIVKALRNKND